MSYMKEQDKTLEEMKIGNLLGKEFRIMIMKMIQDLGKRMEANIKDQTNRDDTISELKNTLEGINNRVTEAEEQIIDPENRMVEIKAPDRIKKKE